MKVLELFSGTQSIGKRFRLAGHDVLSVELDNKFKLQQLTMSVLDLTAEHVLHIFGKPDVIWASPPCTSFSIAAISHHRVQDENGFLVAKSETAEMGDALLVKTLELIRELNPKLWFIENPRGGMRKSPHVVGLDRHTTAYCQYGDTRQKPTDIWTNHPFPMLLPVCPPRSKCHQAAPRGSKTGTQGLKDASARSVIPVELCDHIVSICERWT
jgi:hypothetical protein